MGLDLYAAGRARGARLFGDKSRDVIERIGSWASARSFIAGSPEPTVHELDGKDAGVGIEVPIDGAPHGFDVHAAKNGAVEVDTRWNTIGPGYGMAVSEAVREMGEACGINWKEIETEAAEPGTWATHEQLCEAAVGWLRFVIKVIWERSGDPRGALLAMSPEFSPRLEADVFTPMGPRTLDWSERVRSGSADGADFFPWFAPGLGAPACRSLAEHLMWTRVVWDKPLSFGQAQTQLQARRLLERAHELDPNARLPWGEWHDLLRIDARTRKRPPDPEIGELVSGSEPRFLREVRAKGQDAGASIGYRRHELEYRLPDAWSIVLSGRFQVMPVEDATFFACTQREHVRLSIMRADGKDRAALTNEPIFRDGEITWSEDDRAGSGQFHVQPEDGREVHLLNAVVVTDERLAVMTIGVEDPRRRPWAERVWRSVSPSTHALG